MDKNGFTLIEMLLVLSTVSIMALITISFSLSTIEAHKREQFISTLQDDVLFVQQTAAISDQLSSISLNKGYYSIYSPKLQKPIRRTYPNGLDIDNRSYQYIRFESNGNIRQPGTIHLIMRDERYKIIFPFGKGRYYLEKE